MPKRRNKNGRAGQKTTYFQDFHGIIRFQEQVSDLCCATAIKRVCSIIRMTNATYYQGRVEMNLFTGLKRAVTTSLAIAIVAYGGARIDFDETVDRFVSGERKAAAGYENVSLRRTVNSDGRLEYFIQYGDKKEIPVLRGAVGPQAGSVDYVIENLQSQELAYSAAQKLLAKAPVEKKNEFIREAISQLPKAEEEKYVLSAFERLNPKLKYEVIRAELERTLVAK